MTPSKFYVQEFWLTKLNHFERAEIVNLVKSENNGIIPNGLKGLRMCHDKLASLRTDEIMTYELEQIEEEKLMFGGEQKITQ